MTGEPGMRPGGLLTVRQGDHPGGLSAGDDLEHVDVSVHLFHTDLWTCCRSGYAPSLFAVSVKEPRQRRQASAISFGAPFLRCRTSSRLTTRRETWILEALAGDLVTYDVEHTWQRPPSAGPQRPLPSVPRKAATQHLSAHCRLELHRGPLARSDPGIPVSATPLRGHPPPLASFCFCTRTMLVGVRDSRRRSGHRGATRRRCGINFYLPYDHDDEVSSSGFQADHTLSLSTPNLRLNLCCLRRTEELKACSHQMELEVIHDAGGTVTWVSARVTPALPFVSSRATWSWCQLERDPSRARASVEMRARSVPYLALALSPCFEYTPATATPEVPPRRISVSSRASRWRVQMSERLLWRFLVCAIRASHTRVGTLWTRGRIAQPRRVDSTCPYPCLDRDAYAPAPAFARSLRLHFLALRSRAPPPRLREAAPSPFPQRIQPLLGCCCRRISAPSRASRWRVYRRVSAFSGESPSAPSALLPDVLDSGPRSAAVDTSTAGSGCSYSLHLHRERDLGTVSSKSKFRPTPVFECSEHLSRGWAYTRVPHEHAQPSGRNTYPERAVAHPLDVSAHSAHRSEASARTSPTFSLRMSRARALLPTNAWGSLTCDLACLSALTSGGRHGWSLSVSDLDQNLRNESDEELDTTWGRA
ncbi:hypothetical protein K438DRAFT_1988607 [Mycena galopus ATCC 62051]|nr:hypothetical protein K438DRAFT_1988607 [Mycena galopus ATCC 62051]